MALTIIREANADGICIRLIEQGIASFAITFNDGSLAAIAHRTTDFACAEAWFRQSIEIVSDLGLTHPAWKKPSIKHIQINGE
jgi:hypothetical protein